MEFTKRFREFMNGKEKNDQPMVDLKKLNHVLDNCGVKDSLPKERDGRVCNCPQDCSVCDGTFFPSLLKDMSSTVRFFNKRVKKLLKFQSSANSCFLKCFVLFKRKLQEMYHSSVIQEGKYLLKYAIFNAEAIQEILKKYDKAHCSMKGQRFKSDTHNMHLEILKSPWFCELLALYINILASKDETKTIPGLLEYYSFQIEDGRGSLSVAFSKWVTLSLDLSCSICLETIFDPVSLRCGHIFCLMCACSAANVTTVDGPKAADPKSKCPLCRSEGVFGGAVRMNELSILLRRSLPEYWEERRKKERKARIKEAKAYWEAQSRALMGIN